MSLSRRQSWTEGITPNPSGLLDSLQRHPGQPVGVSKTIKRRLARSRRGMPALHLGRVDLGSGLDLPNGATHSRRVLQAAALSKHSPVQPLRLIQRLLVDKI